MHVYEYSIIRYVPKVEREEFINVGLLVFSKSKRKLLAKFHLDEKKIACFSSEIDFEILQKHIEAFEAIALGTSSNNPIATLEVDERFRWLTAVKSSCIQASRPHPGMTSDLEVLFKNLFQELVL